TQMRAAFVAGHGEGDGGIGHREPRHRIDGGVALGARRFQEFEPRRRRKEQVAHLDPRAGIGGGGFDRALVAALDQQPDRVATAPPRDDGEARHRADRRQRLAAKAERADVEKIIVGQFRGAVPLDRQRQFVGRHAAAVVRDRNQRLAAVAQRDIDMGGAGVDGVLHQFLHRRGRTLDHFARGDAIDDDRRHLADGHAALCPGAGCAAKVARHDRQFRYRRPHDQRARRHIRFRPVDSRQSVLVEQLGRRARHPRDFPARGAELLSLAGRDGGAGAVCDSAVAGSVAPRPAHWRLFAFLGASGIAWPQCITYIGLNYTTAVNGSLLTAGNPFMMVLLAWLIDGQVATGRQLSGMMLSFLGVMVIVAHGSLTTLMQFHFNPGDLLIVVSIPLWCAYSIVLRRRPREMDGLAFLFVLTPIGLLSLAPALVYEGHFVRAPQWSWSTLLAVIYIGVTASAAAYMLWNRGVELLGPSRAAFSLPFQPMFASLLAVMLLGEEFHAYNAIGFVVIVAGWYLSSGLKLRGAS